MELRNSYFSIQYFQLCSLRRISISLRPLPRGLGEPRVHFIVIICLKCVMGVSEVTGTTGFKFILFWTGERRKDPTLVVLLVLLWRRIWRGEWKNKNKNLCAQVLSNPFPGVLSPWDAGGVSGWIGSRGSRIKVVQGAVGRNPECHYVVIDWAAAGYDVTISPYILRKSEVYGTSQADESFQSLRSCKMEAPASTFCNWIN